MAKVKRFLRVLGQFLALTGCLWFCLPFLRGCFEIGSFFGIFVCLLGFLILRYYPHLKEKPSSRRVFLRILTFLYILGLVWVIFLSCLMASASASPPPNDATALVLGCMVNPDGSPSLALRARLSAAYEYLSENPNAVCIVSGGMGDDEPCSEAETMKRSLVKLGIEPHRILLEDTSTSTVENISNSLEIMRQEKLDNEVAIVTHGYHLARSMGIARDMGLEPYGVPAKSDFLLFPQFYGRELLSLSKWIVERTFI